MAKPRRPCQYCGDPLGRWARWLHIYTCDNCAARMGMGYPPRRVTPQEPTELKEN